MTTPKPESKTSRKVWLGRACNRRLKNFQMFIKPEENHPVFATHLVIVHWNEFISSNLGMCQRRYHISIRAM